MLRSLCVRWRLETVCPQAPHTNGLRTDGDRCSCWRGATEPIYLYEDDTFGPCRNCPRALTIGVLRDRNGWSAELGRLAMAIRSPEAEPLLTPAEVATMFRVDPKTVTRWAKAGKLSSIRTLGGHRRYKESEVRGLLTGMVPEQRRGDED